MEIVTLTQIEQARLQVLNGLLAGHMTTDQAATLMGVSSLGVVRSAPHSAPYTSYKVLCRASIVSLLSCCKLERSKLMQISMSFRDM